jgi:hypothetical protein
VLCPTFPGYLNPKLSCVLVTASCAFSSHFPGDNKKNSEKTQTKKEFKVHMLAYICMYVYTIKSLQGSFNKMLGTLVMSQECSFVFRQF